MGMLEMLFGKKKPVFSERIWLNKQAKIADLLNRVQADHTCGRPSVVVAHFQDTLNMLLEIFGKDGVTLQVITNSSQFPSGVPDVLRQKASVLVLTSEAIPTFVARAIGSQTKNTALPPVSVHLIEHYPLPDRDERVLDLDKVWPMKIEFTCYASLEEPWLAAFGADRIREMLSKFGMNKDEVLEHPMLNKSIQAAQKRLAQQVPREQVCESCQAWMDKNV